MFGSMFRSMFRRMSDSIAVMRGSERAEEREEGVIVPWDLCLTRVSVATCEGEADVSCSKTVACDDWIIYKAIYDAIHEAKFTKERVVDCVVNFHRELFTHAYTDVEGLTSFEKLQESTPY